MMLPGSRISSIPSWHPRQPFSLETEVVIFVGPSPSEIVEVNEKNQPPKNAFIQAIHKNSPVKLLFVN